MSVSVLTVQVFHGHPHHDEGFQETRLVSSREMNCVKMQLMVMSQDDQEAEALVLSEPL
jgi:hypothetical protein